MVAYLPLQQEIDRGEVGNGVVVEEPDLEIGDVVAVYVTLDDGGGARQPGPQPPLRAVEGTERKSLIARPGPDLSSDMGKAPDSR